MILSIETSTSNCSVALHTIEGQLMAVKEHNEHNIHASRLFIFIDEILKEQNVSYQHIRAIAVGKGPGSYTGLRIGVSAAKGLCYGLDIPLIGVNTLEGMAFSAKKIITDESAVLIPMLDARRMEVYHAVYDYNLSEVLKTCASVIDEFSYEKLNNRSCYFFGDGMPKCRSILEKQNNTFFIDSLLASAYAVGTLAVGKFDKKEFENTAYFEPFYLKEFVSQGTFHIK